MVEVSLNKIIMHESKPEQAIVLKEKNGQRQVLIVIGIVEAAAIKMKISNVVSPRPLTHDLLFNVIEKSGMSLVRVVITKLEANTFYANMELRVNSKKLISIDARPSDSIALAIMAKAPIFVEEDIFRKLQFLND
ncbi:MAG: bifunctional nuclease family protein [Candidatus Omnitrophota bacterium]|nr:MAG: bifunctional nuclease family protein [Candidatus Omnitrophota bacterium]